MADSWSREMLQIHRRWLSPFSALISGVLRFGIATRPVFLGGLLSTTSAIFSGEASMRKQGNAYSVGLPRPRLCLFFLPLQLSLMSSPYYLRLFLNLECLHPT